MEADSPTEHIGQVGAQPESVELDETSGGDSVESDGTEKTEEEAAKELHGAAPKRRRARRRLDIPNDGCLWQKYGQKHIKGTSIIRYYYKCSLFKEAKCPGKRTVEFHKDAPLKLHIQYPEKHNHQLIFPLLSSKRPTKLLLSQAAAVALQNPNQGFAFSNPPQNQHQHPTSVHPYGPSLHIRTMQVPEPHMGNGAFGNLKPMESMPTGGSSQVADFSMGSIVPFSHGRHGYQEGSLPSPSSSLLEGERGGLTVREGQISELDTSISEVLEAPNRDLCATEHSYGTELNSVESSAWIQRMSQPQVMEEREGEGAERERGGVQNSEEVEEFMDSSNLEALSVLVMATETSPFPLSLLNFSTLSSLSPLSSLSSQSPLCPRSSLSPHSPPSSVAPLSSLSPLSEAQEGSVRVSEMEQPWLPYMHVPSSVQSSSSGNCPTSNSDEFSILGSKNSSIICPNFRSDNGSNFDPLALLGGGDSLRITDFADIPFNYGEIEASHVNSFFGQYERRE